MKQEEIINGNKLIAEFLYPYNNYSTFYIPEHTFIEIKYGEYDSHEIFSIDELKYHSSWDWLMPVVEKIESMGFDSIITNDSFAPHCKFLHAETTIAGNFGETKIEAVWKTVVEFITWYNERNK